MDLFIETGFYFVRIPHFEGLLQFRSQLDFSSESPVCEAFNLYHANFWVIEPATAGHGRGGCSYVELVATSAQMQRPVWQLGCGQLWEDIFWEENKKMSEILSKPSWLHTVQV